MAVDEYDVAGRQEARGEVTKGGTIQNSKCAPQPLFLQEFRRLAKARESDDNAEGGHL